MSERRKTTTDAEHGKVPRGSTRQQKWLFTIGGGTATVIPVLIGMSAVAKVVALERKLFYQKKD